MMTTDAVGGVWTFSTMLAQALGRLGYDILLVTLGPRPSDRQREMVRGQRGVSLKETDILLEWRDPAGSGLHNAHAILGEVADRFSPDLIHFNEFREAMLPWDVPCVLTAHSCVNSWASACGETRAFAGREWQIYTANVRNGLAKADVWVAPTHSFRDLVAQHYNVSNGVAIWNGIEDVYHRSESKQPVILSAGRVWDKAKNILALASIAARLDWPVRIAGSAGENREGIAVPPGCEFL